jgi:hypothetical protein
MGLAAVVLVGLALAGAGATYLAFRYLQGRQTATPVASAQTPAPLPVETATPSPAVAPALPLPATPLPATPPPPTPAPAPANPAPSMAATVEEDPLVELKESLTPAQRRALMSMPRRERMAAIAAARRRLQNQASRPDPGVAPSVEERPTAAPRPARTKINLEVEASQPSTGAQISALYAQVLIDNRPFRDFVIRFAGANSFTRWKKVETVVLENVPLAAREITVAVATDAGLNEERMEGSTRLALQGEETNLSVVVRFYNQFDKSVKFR